MAAIDSEVAILGGGIAGLASAALLSHRGYSVKVFRLNNRSKPRADTLRNQGWLQSGLMYVGKLGRDRKRGRILANLMYNAGLTMLETLGLPVPNGKDGGILRVRREGDEAENLMADAESLGIADAVHPLDENIVKQKIGPLHEDGLYYSIPDAPFPESLVLELLRARAAEFGTAFVECESNCTLEKDNQSPSGHVVVCGEKRFSSLVTILASGAGSFDLLRGLGLDPRMKLQQTPLLVVDGCQSIEAQIFADRPRGFSLVRHPPDSNGFPNGALVIGTTVFEERIMHVPFDERRIAKTYIEQFESLLPPCLRPFVTSGRFTAGYEVVPDGVKDKAGDDLHYVEPWLDWIGGEEGMQLLLVMPGRATLGMHTAEIVLEMFQEQGIPLPSSISGPGGPTDSWSDSIYMHFHPHYTFDDREQAKEGR